MYSFLEAKWIEETKMFAFISFLCKAACLQVPLPRSGVSFKNIGAGQLKRHLI
jgi:hypothetical protein